jgi:hypothetical protein
MTLNMSSKCQLWGDYPGVVNLTGSGFREGMSNIQPTYWGDQAKEGEKEKKRKVKHLMFFRRHSVSRRYSPSAPSHLSKSRGHFTRGLGHTLYTAVKVLLSKWFQFAQVIKFTPDPVYWRGSLMPGWVREEEGGRGVSVMLTISSRSDTTL